MSGKSLSFDSSFDAFANHITINEAELSEEIAGQPELYFTISEKAVECKSQVDAKKTLLDQTLAEADLRIRQDLLESGGKITEGLVSSHVTLDPKVQNAKRDMERAHEEYSAWHTLKDAFLQRSIMLRTLAELEVARMRSSDSVADYVKDGMAQQRAARNFSRG